MKKLIIKIVVLAVVFVSSIFIVSTFLNQGNMDMTSEMGPSTYPIIYMSCENTLVNTLHGYNEEMAANYMRDTITPLSADRIVKIQIDQFETRVKEVHYEVRSLDTKRLVENTKVSKVSEEKGSLYAELNIKDLIDPDTEYILKIILTDENGQKLRYYTRIIQTENLHTAEKLQFVKDFHDKTFDKSAAQDLVIYLESNALGDNSNFHHVTIHSSFDQVTWGNLDVTVESLEIPLIKEINTQTASIQMKYVVSVAEEKKKSEYNVIEYYRVRYTPGRIYLLDFERTMDEIFGMSHLEIVNHKINLGITGSDVKYAENTNGNIVCFVQERTLWSYDSSSDKLFHVFGFRDLGSLDERNNYDQHDIEIIDIDEIGNIQFMVYGYMNRGKYEGTVGIGIYYFNSVTNTVEEEVFIPSEKPYQLLKEDIGVLSYVNAHNIFYSMVNGTIYGIDLDQRTYSVVVSGLVDGSYAVSDDSHMVAWQEEKQLFDSKTINVMNLENGKQFTVQGGAGERVRPIGFMEEDFIYGIARAEDISRDITGTMIFPMYVIKIQNEKNKNGTENTYEKYMQEGVYVVGTEIIDNMIRLSQVRRNASGDGFIAVESGQIMNNSEVDQRKTTVGSWITDYKEKEVQLVMSVKKEASEKPKLLTPKQVLFEESRDIHFDTASEEPVRFYVYAKGNLKDMYTDISAAINDANENSGVVVADNQNYIWEKGNRKTRIQIPGISAVEHVGENTSLSICLSEMLKAAGVTINANPLLEKGGSVISILNEYVNGYVLDLAGCSMDSVLYYVSRGCPVMAMLGEENAVLIVGYDEFNTILLDPVTREPFKKGLNDSREYFNQYGNVFVSYIKTDS